MLFSSHSRIAKVCWLLLLLLLAFHTINNYIILSLDNTFPTYDELDNVVGSINIYKFFKNLRQEGVSLNKIYSWYDILDYTRPPLYRLILSLGYSFQKNINADYSTMVNMLYFVILLGSIYGIGVKLRDNLTGLLAAFVTSMFPAIFAMSRVLMVDFPLTAMVSLSVYLILLTNNFTNTKYSFLFGLSMGLGLLTKVPYLIFILPICGLYIVISVIEVSKGSKKFFILSKNIIFSLLTALFIAGSWYIPNFEQVVQRAKAMSFQNPTGPLGSFIDYYLKLLFSYHLGPIFFILCLLSFFICIIKIRKREAILFLLWLSVPLLIFSCSVNKNPRFILPSLPAIGLLIAYSISLIRKSLIKKVICSLIVVFGLSSYLAISYGSYGEFKPPLYRKNYSFYSNQRVHYGILFPLQVNWKVKEIVDLIISRLKEEDRNRSVRILSLFNIGEIHCVIDYYFLVRGMGTVVECPAQADFFDSLPLEDFPDISSFLFIIKKDGYAGDNEGNIEWLTILADAFERNKDKFFLVGSISNLPDGSKIDVFKNKWLKN